MSCSVTCVSILTRPEGRVQRCSLTKMCARCWFQSSPDPKAGCNDGTSVATVIYPDGFQSSPDPKAGCNVARLWQVQFFSVSILTRPEGRVQHRQDHQFSRNGLVSILTRPEGRVQQTSWYADCGFDQVSILTRPEGRVQPTAAPMLTTTRMRFQSSPDPKAGCNTS